MSAVPGPPRRVRRVVSGGQTGADRAALDAAIALGIEYGGWCPAGGRAEDLPDPPGLLAAYPALRETPDPTGTTRTEWNVRDSDATLVLTATGSVSSPGTQHTITTARRWGRPLLVARADDVDGIRAWLEHQPRPLVLNVAGPRESQAPGLYAAARATLLTVLPDRDQDR